MQDPRKKYQKVSIWSSFAPIFVQATDFEGSVRSVLFDKGTYGHYANLDGV